MSPFLENPELWAAYEPGVRALATRLIRDVDRSEDVVQETWLAAIRQRVIPGDPAAWLRGVVRHQARKAARGEGRRAARERAAARGDESPSADSILEREALRRRVFDAVVKLREPYRTTILLRYFENLPPRAIARQRGVPLETVRTRLSRGIHMLREALDRGEGAAALRRSLAPLAMIGLGAGKGLLSSAVAGTTGVTVMTSKMKLGIAVALLLAVLPLLWMAATSKEDPEGLGPHRRPASLVAGAGDEEPASESRPANATRISSEPFVAESPTAAAPAAAEAFADLTVAVSWADGRPAADVEVSLIPWGGPNPFFHQRWSRTNAKGEVVFARTPVGGVLALAQLGGSVRGRVKAAEDNVLELKIPEGFRVEGVVVDGGGLPVAGATIVLGREGSMNEGRPVTRSDARGRFVVPSVGAGMPRGIGARADGYAPSPMLLLMSQAGAELELRLVLEDGGGTIEGIVLDGDGKPATGALVQVSGPKYDQFTMKDGRQASSPGGVKTRTDDEGRFRVGGLPAGPTRVAVRAEKWAPWKGVAEVVANASHRLEVRLVAGVTVRGQVLNAAGEPVERARVDAGRYGDVTASMTWTRADGTYVLEGVAPGEITLLTERDRLGEARGKLRGGPGDELTWNARLSAGGSIRGLVVDQSRQPLVGWSVSALPHHFAKTDDEGRFEMIDVKPGVYTLKVSQPFTEGEKTRHVRFSAVRVPGIRPDEEPVVIEVPDAELATASFEVRVLDVEDAAVPGTRCILFRLGPQGRRGQEGGWIENPEPETGRYRVAPIPAGRYQLTVSAPGYPRFRTEVHAIAKGEQRDLGIVRLTTGGTLRATILGHVPTSPRGLWVTAISEADGSRGRVEREGALVTSAPLTPGRYTLRLSGLEVVTQEVPFEVEAGEETTLEVTAQPGRAVTIGLVDAAGGSLTAARITIRDAAGRLVTERPADRYGASTTFGLMLALAPGDYRVSAVAGERRAAADLRIDAAEGPARTLTLEF